MTKKERWIQAIINFPANDLSRKELAGILEAKPGKIDYAISRGWLKRIKLGPENSAAEVRITKQNAIDYVNSFDDD